MASKFSGPLTLSGLDDFISPSQECIKPVKADRVPRSKGNSKSVIKIEDDGTYSALNDVGEKYELEKVSITLNDCLACSGCITSAESVLITEQSQEEVRRSLAENSQLTESDKCLNVVTIAPQARASLAVRYGLSLDQTAAKLTTYFHSLGFDLVLDSSVTRELSLIETCNDFLSRWKRRENGDKSALPLLTGICPGWVCYAEKSHGSYVLPHISRVKSPQQIMGSLVKDFIASSRGKPANRVYHVTVMPCYDKKLEASRPDFYLESYETRDVDCVITSGEVVQMLDKDGVELSDLESSALDSIFADSDAGIFSHSGGGSGGYAEFAFIWAARELYSVDSPDLKYTTRRNADLQELTLSVGGDKKLKFALAYGFRNIQNVVQKVKQGRCPYDFVEVMACPSGCLNGGGQVKPSESQDSKELLQRVTSSYGEALTQNPCDSALARRLYSQWLEDGSEAKVGQCLYTDYHEIEQETNALTIKW